MVFPGLLHAPAAAQDTVVSAFVETFFQMRNRLRHVLIGNIRAEDANGLHRVQPQPPCKYIRRIFRFFHHRKNLLLCFFADPGTSVHNPGNGSDRNTRQLCYIVNIHPVTSSELCGNNSYILTCLFLRLHRSKHLLNVPTFPALTNAMIVSSFIIDSTTTLNSIIFFMKKQIISPNFSRYFQLFFFFY